MLVQCWVNFGVPSGRPLHPPPLSFWGLCGCFPHATSLLVFPSPLHPTWPLLGLSIHLGLSVPTLAPLPPLPTPGTAEPPRSSGVPARRRHAAAVRQRSRAGGGVPAAPCPHQHPPTLGAHPGVSWKLPGAGREAEGRGWGWEEPPDGESSGCGAEHRPCPRTEGPGELTCWNEASMRLEGNMFL